MLNIVIARYTEDIRWLNDLPVDARIYLYNKGPAVDPVDLAHPGIGLIPLLNTGRESGTYVHHLTHAFDGSPDDFTVFAQGDPFEHSPGFLDLIARRETWRDVQPLSCQWRAVKDMPPRALREGDRRDWIDSIPVLVERFGLKTCAALDFIWEGSWWIGTAYRQKHALEAGTNILAHFLELCGLHSLSDQARAADVGLFAYGGILAVRHRRITEFLEQAKPHLAQIESLTHGDPLYGYMFEKCWMHMFGEPFVRLPPLVNESEADQRGWNVQPVGIQD